jgi:hypothetical protein
VPDGVPAIVPPPPPPPPEFPPPPQETSINRIKLVPIVVATRCLLGLVIGTRPTINNAAHVNPPNRRKLRCNRLADDAVVVTVTVTVTGDDPLSVTVDLESVHVDFDGDPVQANWTAPLKPPPEFNVSV